MQKVNALEQQSQEAAERYIAAKLSLATSCRLVSLRISKSWTTPRTVAGSPPDRDAALNTALGIGPDYRAAEANVRAAELQVRSVKASGFRPWR